MEAKHLLIGGSLSAYAGSSLVAASMAGPVGLATLAIVGGVLGYYAGTKYYEAITSQHFTSISQAKEEIEQLELGARVLFDEFDPDGTGKITVKNCKDIILRLGDMSNERDNENVSD